MADDAFRSWIATAEKGRLKMMLPPGWNPLKTVCVTLLVLVSARLATSQRVDFDEQRVAMAELTGPWRFHTGDDPTWAEPGFDESHWSLLRSDKGWANQGYRGYGGVAWYRLDVALPSQHSPLALYVPNVDVSCEIFANGRLIGQIGALPPHSYWVSQRASVFPIPDAAVRGSRLLLAIRVWLDPRYATVLPGGLHPAPRIGERETITKWDSLERRELYWENSSHLLQLYVYLLGGLACLVLFVMRRNEHEYLWFGLSLLIWAIAHESFVYVALRPVSFYRSQYFGAVLVGVGLFGYIEFYVALFRQIRGWLYAGASFAALLMTCSIIVGVSHPHLQFFADFGPADLLYESCIGVMVYRAWRVGVRYSGLLLVPCTIGVIVSFVHILAVLPLSAHMAWWLFDFIFNGIRWPFPITVVDINGLVGNLIILAVLIRRYADNRREEERLHSELEAARTVQQVLVPAEIPSISGFQIQAVYKPASQVGGDFYQIIPLDSGGVLAVIGDVSGKGMPAAMTVSLLVGTFRTLAHYTQSPGEILAAMNQRMLARSQGGFTTCLVLRIDKNGAISAANAGHPAPYLRCKEVVLESDLPLGLVAESTYSESSFQINFDEQLTMLTDGVVEARSKTGELFGFERAASLGDQSAESIAKAAVAFGQEDDVTVLTVRREVVRSEVAVPIAAPTLTRSTA